MTQIDKALEKLRNAVARAKAAKYGTIVPHEIAEVCEAADYLCALSAAQPSPVSSSQTGDAVDELPRIIYEAFGELSVSCWSNPEGAGVFQSEKASIIADRVIAEIRAALSEDKGGER